MNDRQETAEQPEQSMDETLTIELGGCAVATEVGFETELLELERSVIVEGIPWAD